MQFWSMASYDLDKVHKWMDEITSFGDDIDFNHYFEMADEDRHLSEVLSRLQRMGNVYKRSVENAAHCQKSKSFVSAIRNSRNPNLMKVLNWLRTK